MRVVGVSLLYNTPENVHLLLITRLTLCIKISLIGQLAKGQN